MEIVSKQHIKGIPVNDLKEGDCFIYDGMYYMKICKNNLPMYKAEEDKDVPCLNLETNSFSFLKRNLGVEKINAKIVIE